MHSVENTEKFKEKITPSHRHNPSVNHTTEATLVEKYGPYTTDYDENTLVKRIKTLCKGTASNTAVWIVSYGAFTIQ